VFTVSWNRFASRLTRFLVRFARSEPARFDWATIAGPYFGNHVGSLRFEGRDVQFTLQKSERVGEVTLATPVPEAARDLGFGARPQAFVTAAPR
jgi:hypothetical protein